MTQHILRTAAVLVLLMFCAQGPVFAGPSEDVDLGPIAISPARLTPGRFPDIEARLRAATKAKDRSTAVTIIAVVTLPDHRIKSWTWKKVSVSPGAVRTIAIPKEYNTTAAGTYRVEIAVYTSDMSRRLARQPGSFEVIGRGQQEQPDRNRPSAAREAAPRATAAQEQKPGFAGLGVYGNLLNPSAGGTIYLWPSRYVGVQGLIATGVFTSYEGRVLVKTDLVTGYALYGGAGYIHVSADKDVIGVATKFEDSGLSGVLGLEVKLGESVRVYVEASGSGIDLERTVTNGARTVKASVKYAPVTVGVSLVMMVF